MPELDIRVRITPRVVRWGLTALCLGLMATVVSPESITLDTYYPAPTGVYVNMVTTQATTLARDGGAVQINGAGGASVDLLVNGRMEAGADGSGNGAVFLNTALNMGLGQTGANLGLMNGGGWNVQITPTGNVGIGTSSPVEALEVNGNIQTDAASACTERTSCSTPNGGVVTTGCPGGDYATFVPGVKPNGVAYGQTPNLLYFIPNGTISSSQGYNTVENYQGCVPVEFECCPN